MDFTYKNYHVGWLMAKNIGYWYRLERQEQSNSAYMLLILYTKLTHLFSIVDCVEY